MDVFMSFCNFNFSKGPEYSLNSDLTRELIQLYGVPLKFLVVSRINADSTVFGDYSHLKSDANNILDVYALPEETSDWDSGGYQLTAFGPINFENIGLFIHREVFRDIIEIQNLTGNLLVFPNNKIMEITNVDPVVPGVNNLFTYQDAKTVLKFDCKPYDYKIISELDGEDLHYKNNEDQNDDYNNNGPYETLDKYFDELMENEKELKEETEVIPSTPTIKPGKSVDKVIEKPVVDNTVDDVFGQWS